MARRKKSDEDAVSLFPFLSILACVIGVLTLMITALALGQMERPEGLSAERAEKYLDTEKKIAQQREEAEKLKALLSQAETLQSAKEELKQLKTEKDKQTKVQEQNVELLAESKQLRDRLAELEPEQKELAAVVIALQTELKKREGPAPEADVVVKPGGSGLNLVPHFVECTANSLVLHDKEKQTRIRRGDMATSPEFLALLDDVASKKNHSVVFLLREDAIGTYNSARSVARDHGCQNGKLPVLGFGRLDLSPFYR